jgi:hypothetical protein
MPALPSLQSRLTLQPWFLGLLTGYAIVELSFNHRLLDLAGGLHQDPGLHAFNELEVWARVVSGLGLALLAMRWLDPFIRSRTWLVVLSTLGGLLVMWHAQKALVDFVVERADVADLTMSAHAQASTAEAVKGRVVLRGEPVLESPAVGELKPVMQALWASSVSGLLPQDLEATSGAAQIASQFAPVPSEPQMRQAYRKVVMTPVALGASLLFGLINLCQLFAGLTLMFGIWLRGERRVRPWSSRILWAWVLGCLSLSWWPENAWVDSQGYRLVARPALWEHQPLLAPFVEWSLRAEPAWSDPVAWVHRRVLQDFRFDLPLKSLTQQLR